MDIKVTGHQFHYDITSMSMLFFPGEKVVYVNRSRAVFHIISSLKIKQGKIVSLTTVVINGKRRTSRETAMDGADIRNLVKRTFYRVCVKVTGITSPWGILTGVNPLSVYRRHKLAGDNADDLMKSEYYLSCDKSRLLAKIYEVQTCIPTAGDNEASAYISIPFCPSKCTYCSFISVAATGISDMVDRYLDCLEAEIIQKSNLIRKNNIKLKSLYFGGGTPGILNEKQLERLLSTVFRYFDLSYLNESCYELGRPDTVTDEKLKILKDYGFSRVCINTQTTNDALLTALNRKHTSSDYFSAMDKALRAGFESINTDLIAGLPHEKPESFYRSLDDAVSAGADNVTVHTLAIKRSSDLKEDVANYKAVSDDTIKMLDYAYNKLDECGFIPYYMYRQKNCVANGENVGFCKSDKICAYNIYMMEDIHSIIACGAGASSKIIVGSRPLRVINPKYPMEYIREFERISENTAKIDKEMNMGLSDE